MGNRGGGFNGSGIIVGAKMFDGILAEGVELSVKFLLGLPIALEANGVAAIDFPAAIFLVVFQYEKGGVFGDDRVEFAESDDFGGVGAVGVVCRRFI